ncbi:hypothetical protein AVEN_202324-1 [Araneus ventricosus]|uniref:Uncharacterized protein n=1 Tax=Araneus ventricosus TaxID=182803 RepID=A0A4Y2E8I4_ARAVE|nr:hypothetical protein AVEN_202324-1 [Araneus ventricosus]
MVFNFASNNGQITVKGGRVDLVTPSHNKRRFRVNGSWYLSWCLSLCAVQRDSRPRRNCNLTLFFSPFTWDVAGPIVRQIDRERELRGFGGADDAGFRIFIRPLFCFREQDLHRFV